MATPCGPKVTATTDNLGMSKSVSRDIWGSNKTVNSSGKAKIQCYRKHKYNDKNLYWTSPNDSGTYVMIQSAQNLTDLGDDNYYLRDFSSEFTINGRHTFTGKNTWSSGSKKLSGFANRAAFYLGMTNRGPCAAYLSQSECVEDNYDTPQDGVGDGDNDFNQKTFTSKWYYTWQVEDKGLFGSGNWTCGYGSAMKQDMWFYYPPYRTLPKTNPDIFPSGPSSGSKDVSDGSTQLTNWWSYSITKSGYSNSLNWSPSTSTGDYGLGITTKAIIQSVEYDATGSSSKSYTHNSASSSYSGYVKRYYTDYSDISTTSSASTAYTYSVPSLSSISLSKSTLSPRSNSSLRVTLNGMNNRTWGVENNYDTKIWSNCNGSKSSPYTNTRTTSNYKDYGQSDIRALFPDTSASNGVVNGIIYTLRRNMGVSGGNPRKQYTNI